MPQDVQTVTVPGVGDLDFPSTMSHDDMSAAIQKNFPQVGELTRQAKANAQSRSSAAISSFGQQAPTVQPPALPSRPIDLPSVAARAQLHNQNTSQWDRVGEMIPQHPGAIPQQDNAASRFVKQHITEPQYLPKAIDEAGQLINAYSPGSPLGVDPTQLHVDPNNPAQHLGTQVIPQLLARRAPAEGTLEAQEPWYKSVPRAVGKAGYDVLSSLSTPAMMGAAVGMEATPASAITKAVGGMFGAEMLKAVPGQMKESYESFRHDDVYGGTEAGAQALMGAGFGTLGVAHLMHGEPLPTTAAETEKAATQNSTPQPVDAVDKPVNVEPQSQAVRGLLAAPASEFGQKLQAAMSGKPTPSPAPVSPLDRVAGNIETAAGEAPITKTPETRVQDFEAKNNMDRETLYQDISAKGRKATPEERQFLIDYQRAAGKPVVAVPPPMPLKAPEPEKVPAQPQSVPVPEEPKPVTPPQAEIPSSPSDATKLESPMRKLAAAIMGTTRLSESATRRLNVEFALREVKGGDAGKSEATTSNLTPEEQAAATKIQGSKDNQSSLADPTKNFKELDKTRQQMIKSVAETLQVPVDSIRSNGWRLTDAQVKELKQQRAAGLKPVSLKELDPTHPEAKFNDNVHMPLADINTANAKAAGIPDSKNLWDQLTPKEKQQRAERKGQQQQAVATSAEQALSPEDKAIREETLGKVAQAMGTTPLDLQERLAGDFKPTAAERAAILKAAKADPSILDGLKNLVSKKVEGTAPTTDAGLNTAYERQAKASGEVTTGGKSRDDLQFEHDMLQNVLRRRLKQAQSALVERIPAWREARVNDTGVSPLATDLANLTPKVLRGIPKELYAEEHTTPKAEQTSEAARVQEPVQGTEKVGTPEKPEASQGNVKKGAGSVTFYSNPIVPMLKKMFGFDKATDVAPLPGPLTLRDSPIEQLSDKVAQEATPDARAQVKAFFGNEASRVQQTLAEAPRITKSVLEDLKLGLKNAWDAYAIRPGMTALRWAYGKRSLQLQQNAIILHEFNTRLNKLFPSHAEQEAMTNYLQADGGVMDERLVNGMLQQKADAFANSSAENARLRKGYLDAQNLSPEAKKFIADYREYDKQLSAQEEAEGLTLQRRENYIRQIWTRRSLAREVGDAVYSAGSFDTSGSFSKMRHFEDYFEGEQSGLVPQNKSMGYLMEARARASAEVLSNRTMIDELYRSTASDGKPLAMEAGTGYSTEKNPSEDSKKGAILVKASRPQAAVSEAGQPYVLVNHPAFQNWKWVGTAEDGTSVLYKGNMLVHPEVAAQLKRILEPSAVRATAIGRGLLKASSVGKQTLLIGLFHPVQLSVHFLEHAAEGGTSSRTMGALNPFRSKPIIDLTDKVQQMLVVHGLKVADFNAESLWDEGVMSRGFAAGMPVVGQFWRTMHDSMFQKYIPNLKMGMALDALDRNMSRYHDQYRDEEIAKVGGNVTPEERELASQQAQSRIHRMTAEQMNAAFGGIDWAGLPINKTWQDVARLTVLAPDFLLARMQFAGDAFRPGGWESRKALLAGALVQYTAARAFNSAMNDGDPKWDIHDWNKFIVGKNEYSLRTVQGDMMDSVLDTRRFVEHRLNPLIMRPLMEAGFYPGATGPRDVYGHPLPPGWLGAGQQLTDFAKNLVPIPAQGLVDALAGKKTALRGPQNDDRIADSLIQSMTGVRRSKYQTPAERVVQQHFNNLHPSTTPDDQLSMAQKNTFNRLLNEYQKGKMTDDDLENALNDPKANLKQSEVRYLYRVRNETAFKRNARQLPFMDLMDAWDKAKPAEKFQLAPLLQHKLSTLAPSERDKYQDMLDTFRDTLSDQDSQKISEEINKDVILENPPAPPEQ